MTRFDTEMAFQKFVALAHQAHTRIELTIRVILLIVQRVEPGFRWRSPWWMIN